jgi:hypothetical protein
VLELVNTASQRHEPFKRFLEERNADERCGGAALPKFMALLALPTTRLAEYTRFVERVRPFNTMCRGWGGDDRW